APLLEVRRGLRLQRRAGDGGRAQGEAVGEGGHVHAAGPLAEDGLPDRPSLARLRLREPYLERRSHPPLGGEDPRPARRGGGSAGRTSRQRDGKEAVSTVAERDATRRRSAAAGPSRGRPSGSKRASKGPATRTNEKSAQSERRAAAISFGAGAVRRAVRSSR